MGGNAINLCKPITFIEAEKTLLWIKKEIIPSIDLEDSDIDVIGSFCKKKEGELYGDIDIAVDINSITKKGIEEKESIYYLEGLFKKLEFETKINFGFGIVSAGIPIDGDFSQGLVQVDFMLTPDLNWSKFIYYSPNFRINESQYKGKIRNILLMAIITESQKEIIKYTPDGGIEEIEVNILRYPKGIWRVRKNFMGKKGLIKNGKNVIGTDHLITTNPQKVKELTVGTWYKLEDINTFEKLWEIILSPNFIWKDKRLEIISRYKECLAEQGFEEPKELLCKIE